MSKKYFYVSYTGMTTKTLDTPKDEEIIPGQISSNDKVSIPVQIYGGEILTSEHGMFLPHQMEYFLCVTHNLEKCFITFVREMTQEEVDYEKNNKVCDSNSACFNQVSKKENEKIKSEIDDLINAAENGNLRINVDPNSEKPNQDEKGLEGLGGLFNANPWGDD